MHNDIWARVCYKHSLSKYQDGYAREHWLPLDKAKENLEHHKNQGRDCFIEIQDAKMNRASGERIK